jgi:hypothetical protein
MKNLSKKFQSLPKLTTNSTIPFSSEGEFSMHELIEFLLSETGPAKLKVSSFSISEVATRMFLNCMENGLITELQCVLDLSVKRHKLGLLYFASNIGTVISLIKCHAKIILIENENWHVTVIGSANLQVNDKIEAGVIFTGAEPFNFFSDKFEKWFNSGMKIDANEFK